MRRRLSWTLVGIVVWVGMLVAGCGGTGGGGSSAPEPGEPFVFTARGSLIPDSPVVDPDNPAKATLTATLLDPQGRAFPNQLITFTADFPDATIIPGNDNTGAVLTDGDGKAQVTIIAGLTTGRMRVIAEAPPQLNISTAVSMNLTTQGFISLGSLGIIPTAITFINPNPETTAETKFQAMGGTPPYSFSNSNPSVGKIETQGSAGEIGLYTLLIGPLPTAGEEERQDTITLLDAAGGQTTATVQVLFAECDLNISPEEINFGAAVGGERAQITITNGVPPFTATQTFPDSGSISINQEAGIVTFTIATPPVGVAPDTILIRDSRGCTATVEITVTPAVPQVTTIVLTANPTSIDGAAGGMSIITATVLDENNQPLEGVSVLFTTTVGTLSAIVATTDASGQATATLTIPAGTPEGIATVTGSAAGVSGTVDVTITAGAVPIPGGPGAPASIQFVSAVPTTIGVKGSGLPEQSVLTFLVTDSLGMPVSGVTVNFFLTASVGGEFLTPTTNVTDSDGLVQTTLTSGTRATDVQVTAAIDTDGDGDFDILATFTPVTIFGAPPVQGSFSLAALPLNIAGQVTFGLTSTITAFVGDRFGNPVPPNTAVSFTSNGGSVSGQGLTNDFGQATATLVSQAPIPDDDPGVDDGIATGEPDGVVTVLASTTGEEPFTDVNGNGVFDAGEPIENDAVPEPFIDENLNGVFDSDNPFELFIDTNGNGVWDTAQGTQGVWDSAIFVWDTIPVTFSAHTIVEVDCGTVTGAASFCVEGVPTPSDFAVADGGSVKFTVTVRDPDFNPIVGGSTIDLSPTAGTATPASFTVPDASSFGGIVSGLNRFTFTLADDDPADGEVAENVTVTVTVTSPNGDRSVSFEGKVD